MKTAIAAAIATTLLALTPQASAYYPYSGTSSTADVDTYNLPSGAPYVPECTVQIKKPVQCDWPVCPAYFAYRAVVLKLLDPSPGDIVSLEAFGGQMLNSAPADVATYADPVAHVNIQVGGCAPGITAVVSGILVDGEVAYELTIEDAVPLPEIVICLPCADPFPIQLP